MSRLKNRLNQKDRSCQVVQTDASVVYKVPIGNEGEFLGHFIESEIIEGFVIFRFATKKNGESGSPFKIIQKDVTVSFD